MTLGEYTAGYLKAIEVVLKHEGGYSDHPNDPGGATNFGITQRTFDAYQRDRGGPTYPVRNLKHPEVLAFYHAVFWTPMGLDRLPPEVALLVLDGAVNSGPRAGTLFAQRAYNIMRPTGWDEIKEDGVIGPNTRSALTKAYGNAPKALLTCMLGERYLHFSVLVRRDDKFRSFMRGWANRLDALRG
jgi:lysozyme family protein